MKFILKHKGGAVTTELRSSGFIVWKPQMCKNRPPVRFFFFFLSSSKVQTHFTFTFRSSSVTDTLDCIKTSDCDLLETHSVSPRDSCREPICALQSMSIHV